MNIAAFLFAFMKAFPAAQKIFSDLQDMIYKSQEAADINSYDHKKVLRDALVSKLKTGISDDEAKNIRRALFDLNHK